MSKVSLTLLAVLSAFALLCASASALTPEPGWEVSARSYPTSLPPRGTGNIEIDLYNLGAAPSTGTVTVTDVLPPGMVATDAGNVEQSRATISHDRWDCAGTTVVTCTNDPEGQPVLPAGGIPGENGARTIPNIGIAVKVTGEPGEVLNHVTVSGGGAPGPASAVDPMTISATPSGFGIAGFDGWFSNADGTLDTQAGSHPYEATFSLDLNTARRGVSDATPASDNVRAIDVQLPPGLIGDPQALPQCTRAQLDGYHCPVAAQIGVIAVPTGGERFPFIFQFPVFNMVPPPGVPAQFAFTELGITTFLDAGVRSGSDYGITEHTDNISQQAGPVGFSITLWGVPADPSHDAERETSVCPFGCSSPAAPTPFLTLPTSCAGPQTSFARARGWSGLSAEATDAFVSHDANGAPTGFTGCDHLGFGPALTAVPDTSNADTPAGLTAEVKVAQQGLLNPEGVASANIKDTTVTLPPGLVINPGQAAGLLACQAGEDGVGSEAPPTCPSASKVGTDQIETPLLKDKLEGDVYVLQSNPPNLKLLVAASADGVNLKLIGDVHLDEATGQLVTTFANTPELPFTDFKLSFSGGAQAALDTPTECGAYAVGSDFVPWSAPFISDVLTTSSFAISAGPNGSACASPPFSPTLTAGATTDQAGGYTSFSLLLQRADGQQRISSLRFKTPEGLLGMISKVPLCGEPQAAQGTCSAASQIGHTVVAAGPGPYPLVVPGPGAPAAPIYLTGAYKGAPYGLSVAVPVIAGPFDLGTVVVRASISVDPHTSQLTVTTDPLPSILDGIPTDLRTINAVIDRPGFMFNPTDCSPMSFSGTATSTTGTQAAIASHFQVGSCRSLTFKPNFKVSTAGKTSRKNGASLDAKIVYPTGVLGANQASSQANIASVKVDLPKQLPSRLTTLQKACTSAQFDANPAGCPRASLIGHATAITPVLPVPLSGPAYFVSRGGEAFPQLIVVLQGYGVTVDLVGDTFIGNAGITSSTFKQVPDVPIASFELSLPEGPFSALAANLPAKAKGSFCGQKLSMPTAFVGQNGAVIHQSTKITVSGCAKAKQKPKVKSKRAAKRK